MQGQEPSHINWLQQAGGPNQEHVSYLKKDASGNQYLLGSFSGAITIGGLALSTGLAIDYFVAKYNPEGELQWAHRLTTHLPSEGSYKVNDMHVAADGTITLAGSYSGDLSIGSANFYTPPQGSNIFYTRLATNGHPLWTHSLGSWEGYETAEGLDVDIHGNIYLTGTLLGQINLTGPEEKKVYTAYLLKTNNQGSIQWVKQNTISPFDQEYIDYVGTPDQWDQYTPRAFGKSVKVDNEGNIILAGSVNLTVFWDGQPVSSKYARTYDNSVYIIKFTPQGQPIWSSHIENHYESGSTFNVLEVDKNGNIYIAGHYQAAIIYEGLSRYTNDINFFPDVLHELYVLKISPAGQGLWLKGVTDATTQDPYLLKEHINTVQSLVVDAEGRLFVTGYLARNAVTFDNILITPTPNHFDRYAAELSSSGEWQWVKQLPVNGPAEITYTPENTSHGAISMDLAGNLILAGDFWNNFNVSGQALQSKGASDIFLTSLSFTVPQVPIAGKIQSFTLVNARTNQDIMEIKNGDVLYLDNLPPQLNIRANTAPDIVGSVQFQMDNKKYNRIDNDYPYTLGGDHAATGNYFAMSPELKQGAHKLSATSYSNPNASGQAGEALHIMFKVMQKKPKGHKVLAIEGENLLHTGIQAYPNPFSHKVAIEVHSAEDGRVVLEIYDMQGRMVNRVFEGYIEAGNTSTYNFDGSYLPAGIYIGRLTTASGTYMQKLVLSR